MARRGESYQSAGGVRQRGWGPAHRRARDAGVPVARCRSAREASCTAGAPLQSRDRAERSAGSGRNGQRDFSAGKREMKVTSHPEATGTRSAAADTPQSKPRARFSDLLEKEKPSAGMPVPTLAAPAPFYEIASVE